MLLELDTSGKVLYANSYVKNTFEFEPEELIGENIFGTIVPEYDQSGLRLKPVLDKLLFEVNAQDTVNENENITKSGRRIWMAWHNHPILDEQNKVIGQYCLGLDLTDRKQMEDDLRQAKQGLEKRVFERTKELKQANRDLQDVIHAHNMSMVELKLVEEVLNHSLEGITITDQRAFIQKVNPAFTTITGYTPEEAIGQNTSLLKSNRHGRDFYQKMWGDLLEHGHWSGEIWNRRKNGEAYPEWLSIGAVKDEFGDTTHYVAVFHDLSEYKQKEEQLSYELYFDGLTGLPNRRLFQDRVRMSINQAERNDSRLALIHIDIDNFKGINDGLGVLAGDELIAQVAERLKNHCRKSDNLARLGGDDYALLMEDVADTSDVVHLVESLLDVFDSPFRVKNRLLYLTASAGVAFFPNDGMAWDHLFKNAELAMYRAKKRRPQPIQNFHQHSAPPGIAPPKP